MLQIIKFGYILWGKDCDSKWNNLLVQHTIFFQIILVVAALFVCTKAAPQQTSEPIPIVKYDNEGVNADGSYQWR